MGRTLNSKLKDKIDATTKSLDTKLSREISEDKKAITDLQTNSVQMFISRFNIRFIGIGMRGSQSECKTSYGKSLSGCLEQLQLLRSQSSSWNGISYAAYDKYCVVSKNDRGH